MIFLLFFRIPVRLKEHEVLAGWFFEYLGYDEFEGMLQFVLAWHFFLLVSDLGGCFFVEEGGDLLDLLEQLHCLSVLLKPINYQCQVTQSRLQHKTTQPTNQQKGLG